MSALGSIYGALKTLIATDATTAALLANSPGVWVGTNGKAVYDDGEVPQFTAQQLLTAYPLVAVGAGTEVQASTLGVRGWNATVQVKPIAKTFDDVQEVATALSVLFLPVPPRVLSLAGFTSCWIEDVAPQSALQENSAGTLLRSIPLIVRVYAT